MEKELPEFFIQKLNEQYGEDISKDIIKGLKENKKTTFRVNRIKSNLEEIEEVLNKNNISFSKPDFYEDGYILDENSEDKIRALEIYSSGKIYLQSLSSMVPVLVLEPKEKENILDMCSAPRRKDNSNFQCFK